MRKDGEYRMTENKRFLIGDAGELIDLNNHKFIAYGDECCKLLNELHDENQELKLELHKIYELATVDKVRDIVENVYDDLLYETSDESDHARTKVLKCLEYIDNLRDDF